VRVSEILVALLVAVTFAPGIIAPVLSDTVPVIAPSPAVCAFNVMGSVRRANNVNRKNTLRTDFVDVQTNGSARFILPRRDRYKDLPLLREC
jgi:hypothetical protein